MLAARLELASRPNLGLTAYKTAALPIVLRQQKVALSAGVEPASFQLRLTRLEGETDTRANHFAYLIYQFSFSIRTAFGLRYLMSIRE